MVDHQGCKHTSLGAKVIGSIQVNSAAALKFVRRHGVVLESAKGPVPRLVEAILGEPITGSWWSHPKGRDIYQVLQAVALSPEILVCRLVGGKVTFVHRRLWPALVTLAGELDGIARVSHEHTAAGHHETHETAFPDWVPREVLDEARLLSEADARKALGAAITPLRGATARAQKKK
jgi:hypothetical protein